ncbi:malyl thiolesterase [Blastocystis sp. subtype 4]|uniref:malyl thiolesterase n=1 Tax=Blastocystis sp. subtype 4 TaxID=944170 RepID=UPI000711DA30|nr:malyl thiolesterase [Blastocystis sp. subtype 4]KNB45231.1 malyl thiolesterase [Blastocystis sp. subtype 4]|eukprot:XP_014528674.1 malyl thiolesterase [Blastocystis sp. subtype 4]
MYVICRKRMLKFKLWILISRSTPSYARCFSEAAAPFVGSNHPRRSVLYMPGSNARAMEKGKSLPADSLILDLEDAVAINKKVRESARNHLQEEARKMVADQVRKGGYGLREICVRVNSLDTPWGEDDVRLIATCGCNAIALPKVERADQILKVDKILRESGADPKTEIWSLIETPRGILNADEICGCLPRNTCIIMGTSDLSKELNVTTRRALQTSLQLVVLAAKKYSKGKNYGEAVKVVVLDGVYLNVKDLVGFEKECIEGKEFGFDGKTLIHPSTIEITNKVFAPSEQEVEDAKNIISLFHEAEQSGKGVVTYKGKLVENLHVVMAEKIVQQHELIEKMK